MKDECPSRFLQIGVRLHEHENALLSRLRNPVFDAVAKEPLDETHGTVNI